MDEPFFSGFPIYNIPPLGQVLSYNSPNMRAPRHPPPLFYRYLNIFRNFSRLKTGFSNNQRESPGRFSFAALRFLAKVA
jgi:hypothetical protein